MHPVRSRLALLSGVQGSLTFSDGESGVFDPGQTFYAGSSRQFVTLMYGTLRTKVTVPLLDLLTSGAASA